MTKFLTILSLLVGSVALSGKLTAAAPTYTSEATPPVITTAGQVVGSENNQPPIGYAKIATHARSAPDPGRQQRIAYFVDSLTPGERAALAQQLQQHEQSAQPPPHYHVSFYQPTYVLPFYYTGRPYQSIYAGTTPDNQRIDHAEFKAQFSFKFPLWLNIFHSKLALNMYYTQLSYWQVYARSQYFRETNYEPALYFSYPFGTDWSGWLGVVHQSNGRGGELERSWNRLFIDVMYRHGNFSLSIRPWLLIFKRNSSDLHNPNIAHFLGHERLLLAYTFHRQTITFVLRNTVESRLRRGAIELDYSFPIYGVLHGYVQFFSGYGQSLIEYDHYTNSVGIGFAVNTAA